MSQNKVPQWSKEVYSIPGKVFVLGEYAILKGMPCLVAAVGPRFGLKVTESGQPFDFHPESPVGKLENWVDQTGLPKLVYQFEDPHSGAGGFGASTAQFAMAYLAYAQHHKKQDQGSGHWKEVWTLYRELTQKGGSVPPSGADLIAQWQGGVVYFDPSSLRCEDYWPIFDWSNLLVFSATGQAGRKVPTHGHLTDLMNKMDKLSLLEQPLVEGLKAVQTNDAVQLGKSFDQYAETLRQLGLEISFTYDDRTVLRKLPGVLGVKGAGALQSDAVLVLIDPKKSDRQQIIHTAQGRGLQLLADGMGCQMGVTCQN